MPGAGHTSESSKKSDLGKLLTALALEALNSYRDKCKEWSLPAIVLEYQPSNWQFPFKTFSMLPLCPRGSYLGSFGFSDVSHVCLVDIEISHLSEGEERVICSDQIIPSGASAKLPHSPREAEPGGRAKKATFDKDRWKRTLGLWSMADTLLDHITITWIKYHGHISDLGILLSLLLVLNNTYGE
ncbi:hypothetical protein C8J56DRAFT_894775 [Mycena floridula]|nr:hypothetical protein C8J56DRAFT_894775 [Mycena floridula]